MKNRLVIPSLLLLFVAVHLVARQTPSVSPTVPCNDQTSDGKGDDDDKKKNAIEHDPLADPNEEMRIRNQKKMDEKNFKELQDAATDLATVSARMSKEIDASGQYVLSLRVLNDLDQIEKLTKKVRSRAK
ncbi:MAG TPA: hypothetical protein VFO86_12910 [Terriglobia bacterium]|nr:hypothetical protein [Terriglobia bacterium]